MVGTRLQQDFGVLRQLRGAAATTGMLVGGTHSMQLSQPYFHQQKVEWEKCGVLGAWLGTALPLSQTQEPRV